ncbi:cell wall assembly regulator SMI1 [Clostridium tetanomorphum]|uniref:SMI1/KNR4 family protein n=1 Tax=Clostridium tetanomorphum TaxID=1553 RepID=A0A923EC31_CLOTT|nr:SMI1/KNR4 family protein [Clostridium tetanomorphum]KAJ53004.1 beta-1 3-glucan synthesis protein [Clostridium tetanomorphum DSM 665]MBC2398536.1 SMI1/KNR4 family protein [Clostridium tetanomorphum]MBP1864947.1 cell wall assembly regulator SMI1 [Clostridium tetanomorphum]NRS83153.1 cell wall assembly regulator SMI1 [Clostridium tetanomorphum]NRZ98746.1 cell wall assembly regulator SMI1 [Clostridium tetanomorphum]
MQNQLEILDTYLRKLRPDFYSELNDPLKENEIKDLEAKFNVILPEDLKLLYKWKNGQKGNCYESFANNSTFIPLEEALNSAKELTSMIDSDFDIDNWWNENWIPILENGGGDSICYDIAGIFTNEKGQLIEFWHEDNDRNVIAPNLKSFIEAINRFYETKEAKDFDEYFEIDNIEGFPKSFYVE